MLTDEERLDILWAEREQIQGVIRFLRYGLGLATGILGLITTALALGGS